MLVAFRNTRLGPPRESCPIDTLKVLNSVPAIPSELDKRSPGIILRTQKKKSRLKFDFSSRRKASYTPAKPANDLKKSSTREENHIVSFLKSTSPSALPGDTLRSKSSSDARSPEAADSVLEIHSCSATKGEGETPYFHSTALNQPELNAFEPEIEAASSLDPETIPLEPLRRLAQDCYVVPDVVVEPALLQEFRLKIKGKLLGILLHLPLQDRQIMLDCVSTCPDMSRSQIEPTILFLCLNETQQKSITSCLKKRDFIPSSFRCRVIVQEISLCSSTISTPLNPGPMSGSIVEASFLTDARTMCGTLSRILNFNIKGGEATLGGLIRVGGSIYALTTAHTYIGKGPTGISQQSNSDFEPIGNLHSYKFTESLGSPEEAIGDIVYDQDWAIVRVQPSLYKENSYFLPGSTQKTRIEGHLRSSDLHHGPVVIPSSLSGIRQGFLTASTGSVILGSSCFEVKSISLDSELASGDSGSWVIREGKLCGYIIARIIGQPWAYMLPIWPVFDAISKSFSADGLVSVEVPSGNKMEHLKQTTVSLYKGGEFPRTALPDTTRQENRSGTLEDDMERDGVEREETHTKSFTQQIDKDLALLQDQYDRIKAVEKRLGSLRTLEGQKDTGSPAPSIRKDDLEKGQDQTEKTTEEPTDPFEVGWDGNDDPKNPQNWPLKNKLLIIILISALSFAISLASTILAPTIPTIMAEFQITSAVLSSFVVSVFVLGSFAGPLLFIFCKTLFGRLSVYHICNLLFVVFTVACALSKTIGVLIVFRFLTGVASSGSLIIGGGTISELSNSKQRIQFMAVYATCRLWGPAIGPVIGAYLARAEGWRWLFWLVAIASGCLAICCFVALPETTPAIILARKARRLRRKTGNERYQSKLGPSSLSLNEHLRAIRRPARVILLSPIVLCTSICAGVVFGEIYILYTTFTLVFERTYDFSTGAAGLSFLGIGVGMTLGAMLSPLNDRIVKRLTLRANGVFRPEMRLPAMMISSSLIGIGFVLYGWTLQYKVHYMVPIVGTSFIGGGAVLFLVITQEYLMLAFPTYAIDAFAAIIVVREIMAGVLPLAGWKIYEHLGYGWGNTLLASLALLLIPISWVLYLYGERVRNKHPLKL